MQDIGPNKSIDRKNKAIDEEDGKKKPLLLAHEFPCKSNKLFVGNHLKLWLAIKVGYVRIEVVSLKFKSS
jgi:hypothetical protein